MEVCANIDGAIDWSACHQVRAALASCGSTDTFALTINSHGGEHAPAFTMADAIRAHRGTTIGRVHSICNSAAILVYAACGTRCAGRNASFHMHTSATGRWALPDGRLTAKLLQREADEQRSMDARYRDRICRYTGIAPAELAELEDAERTIYPREAVALGLVHVIYGAPDLTASAKAARERARQAALPAPHVRHTSASRARFVPIAAPFVGLRVTR